MLYFSIIHDETEQSCAAQKVRAPIEVAMMFVYAAEDLSKAELA